jgi:hypothetical protein
VKVKANIFSSRLIIFKLFVDASRSIWRNITNTSMAHLVPKEIYHFSFMTLASHYSPDDSKNGTNENEQKLFLYPSFREINVILSTWQQFDFDLT